MPDRSELYADLEADLRRRRIDEADRLLEIMGADGDATTYNPRRPRRPIRSDRIDRPRPSAGHVYRELVEVDAPSSTDGWWVGAMGILLTRWYLWVALVFILQLTAAALAWLTP